VVDEFSPVASDDIGPDGRRHQSEPLPEASPWAHLRASALATRRESRHPFTQADRNYSSLNRSPPSRCRGDELVAIGNRRASGLA
jgi:hypothetical protein